VKNSHVHLGDVGITGNGHMMMLEKNNQTSQRSWPAGSRKTSSEGRRTQIAETPAE